MRKVKFIKTKDDFLKTLNQKVQNYFELNRIEKTANAYMRFKFFFLLIGVLFFYVLMYFFSSSYVLILLTAFMFGTFSFLVAFNIVHDAGHGALFKKSKHNLISLRTLDLFGVSSCIWKFKHDLHHHSPNVKGADTLVDDFKLGRLLEEGEWRPFFKYQHLYIPFLSLLYSASLVLFKDFVIIKSLKAEAVDQYTLSKKEFIQILLSKVFVFFTTLYLPFVFLHLSLLQLAGLFTAIHLGPGLLVGFFVAPAHFNSHVDFPQPDKNGIIHSGWAEHQLITTEDFGTDSRILNFMLGGFNHHVAHHLYPGICHCHYPNITPIIKATAEQFNVPYKSCGFIHVYISHLKYLKQMGKQPETIQKIDY